MKKAEFKKALQAELKAAGFKNKIVGINDSDIIHTVIIFDNAIDVMSDVAQWLNNRFTNGITIASFDATMVSIKTPREAKSATPTFTFWFDNQTASPYTLTAEELKARFMQWLKKQVYPSDAKFTRNWLENMGVSQSVPRFVGEPESKGGLQSVAESETYIKIGKIVKDDFWNYCDTLQYA